LRDRLRLRLHLENPSSNGEDQFGCGEPTSSGDPFSPVPQPLARASLSMGATSTRLTELSPAAALARIHEAEERMVLELAAVREAITQIETALTAPPGNVNLLTVVETARELRVSRSRVFELLAAGEL